MNKTTHIWIPLFSLALVVLLSVGDSFAAKPTAYPMHCKAGDGLRLNVVTSGNRTPTLEITFKKGTTAARAKPPKTGECTWANRGLWDNEPNKIGSYGGGKHVPDLTVRFTCDGRNCRYTGYADTPPHGSWAEQWDRLIKKIQAGDFFKVFVYNCKNVKPLWENCKTGNGWFQLDRVGGS